MTRIEILSALEEQNNIFAEKIYSCIFKIEKLTQLIHKVEEKNDTISHLELYNKVETEKLKRTDLRTWKKEVKFNE